MIFTGTIKLNNGFQTDSFGKPAFQAPLKGAEVWGKRNPV
jgi:hypothetical protein